MIFGVGYQGSKNKLAQKIINTLPPATHFYDLFCGGGAISHCALMSGKWRQVHFSDHDDVATLLRDLLEGNLPDGSEWVSREDFYARKDKEPWVRVLWSWSGNCRDYIYSRVLEPYKKTVHEMIYAETPNERRLKFKTVCKLMAQLGGGGITDHRTSSISKEVNDMKTNKLPPPQQKGNQPIGNIGTIWEEHGFLESEQRHNRCREALQNRPF